MFVVHCTLGPRSHMQAPDCAPDPSRGICEVSHVILSRLHIRSSDINSNTNSNACATHTTATASVVFALIRATPLAWARVRIYGMLRSGQGSSGGSSRAVHH